MITFRPVDGSHALMRMIFWRHLKAFADSWKQVIGMAATMS